MTTVGEDDVGYEHVGYDHVGYDDEETHMTGRGTNAAVGRPGPEFIDDLLALALRFASSGGDVARRMLAEFDTSGLDSRSKTSATDPVTVIDTSVEQHLRKEIESSRPGDRVLGEEGGEESGSADAPGGRGGVRWIVDPVDGTVNLLYGIPFTAVSVAAEVDGVVVAGAVHNIVTRETWSAGLGRGATLREADGTSRALRTSACVDLSLSLVGTGFSYDAGIRAEQGRVVAGLLPRVRDIRRCGSAALDLCMVAGGRLDAYYERGLKPWDYAAGALVAGEAGAMVTVSDDPAVPTTAASPGVAEDFLGALDHLSAGVNS